MESCEKAFAQLSNLQNHMKQHEKELSVAAGAGGAGGGSRDVTNGKKPYNCHVGVALHCGKFIYASFLYCSLADCIVPYVPSLFIKFKALNTHIYIAWAGIFNIIIGR